MDKNEGRNGREKQKVVQKELKEIATPYASEHTDSIRGILEQIDEQKWIAIRAVRKDMKRIFSDKKTLNHILNLVRIVYDTSKYNIRTAIAVDYLNKKMEIIEKIVEKIEDLPEKEDLEKLKNISTQMAHIDAVISAIQAQSNGTQEKTDNKKSARDSYVS